MADMVPETAPGGVLGAGNLGISKQFGLGPIYVGCGNLVEPSDAFSRLFYLASGNAAVGSGSQTKQDPICFEAYCVRVDLPFVVASDLCNVWNAYHHSSGPCLLYPCACVCVCVCARCFGASESRLVFMSSGLRIRRGAVLWVPLSAVRGVPAHPCGEPPPSGGGHEKRDEGRYVGDWGMRWGRVEVGVAGEAGVGRSGLSGSG